MKNFIFIFTFFLFVSIPSKQSFTQTANEINQLLNEDTRTEKEKKKEQREEKKKEKTLTKINKKSETETNEEIQNEEKTVEKETTVKSESEKQETKTAKQTKDKKPNNKRIEKKLAKNEIEGIERFGPNKLFRKGKRLHKDGAFYSALEYLNVAFSKSKRKKQKLKIGLIAGDLSLELREYKQAEKYLEEIVILNKNHKKHPLIEFQLANAYKYLAKYDTAISLYSKFLKLQAENDELGKVRRKARLEKKGAVYALQLNKQELDFTIENVGNNVNGRLADYGPELLGNKLFFSKIFNEISPDSKIYYSEIYDDKFNVFQDFSDNINQSQINVGNPSFTSDGNTVYFTECIIGEDFKSQCKIMRSEKIDNIWQTPEKLNVNINLENSNNTQPQITMSPSGIERLFFVSNRMRSKGGKDIWYSDIDEEGNFSRAKNLGNPFNTSFDEVSPFYHKETNTLYFSSNGHLNIGGFDVFKVENYFREDEEIDYEVKNLNYPVNSSVDDYDFVINKNEELGFLSSNRKNSYSEKNETCCDDIFVVKTTKVDLYIKGFVYADNNSTRLKYDKADLILYDASLDKKIENISENKKGSFITKIEKDKEYKLKAVSDDFQDEEILFSTVGIQKSDTLQYDVFLKDRNLKDFMIAKVYYQFDVSKLREDAPDTLRKVINFMEVYPDIIVEVASHTDSKGSEEYNLALSEKRSLAVKNYLIYQAKINSNRLVNKWYGESKPSVPNTNDDGSDNPEGRDLNRRTEFIIIGTLETKPDED